MHLRRDNQVKNHISLAVCKHGLVNVRVHNCCWKSHSILTPNCQEMTHCLFFMEASWEDLAFIPTDLDVGYFFTYRAKHTGPSSAGCMFFAFCDNFYHFFSNWLLPIDKGKKKNQVRKLIFFSHYTNRKSTADLKIRRSQQGFVCVCATLLSGVGKF